MRDLRVMERTGCESGVELFPQSSIYDKAEGYLFFVGQGEEGGE